MWEVFFSEAQEKLQELEEALLAIETQGVSPERFAAMYRAIHTFKGNSRIMGLSQLEALAHRAEDLMGLVRDHGLPFDTTLAALFFQVLDRFRMLLQQVCQQRQDIELAAVADLYDLLTAAQERAQTKLDTTVQEPLNAAPESGAEIDAEPEADIFFQEIYLDMISQDFSRLEDAAVKMPKNGWKNFWRAGCMPQNLWGTPLCCRPYKRLGMRCRLRILRRSLWVWNAFNRPCVIGSRGQGLGAAERELDLLQIPGVLLRAL